MESESRKRAHAVHAHGRLHKAPRQTHKGRNEMRQMNMLPRILALIADAICLFCGCIFFVIAKSESMSTERLRYISLGVGTILFGAILLVLILTH